MRNGTEFMFSWNYFVYITNYFFQTNEIFQSIYDLPWFDEEIEIRMTLNLMLLQSRKQFVLNYHQGSNLNLQTFMQVTYLIIILFDVI